MPLSPPTTPSVACRNYPNAKCIYYAGSDLVNLGVTTNERLDSILVKINALVGTPGSGTGDVTMTGTQTLTNKTISGASNTITNLPASSITSGVISTARLGTGTANNTTILRGDGSWVVPTGGIEIAATYSAITGGANPRFIYVTQDETNNGDISFYLHNGTSLKLLATLS